MKTCFCVDEEIKENGKVCEGTEGKKGWVEIIFVGASSVV